MATLPFALPALSAHPSFPELFLKVAQTNLHSDPAIFLLSDSILQEVPPVEKRSWNRIICELHYRVEQLLQLSGRNARRPDQEQFTIGILQRPGYDFWLTCNAAMLLRWTVNNLFSSCYRLCADLGYSQSLFLTETRTPLLCISCNRERLPFWSQTRELTCMAMRRNIILIW
jgi:hypothetical protein